MLFSHEDANTLNSCQQKVIILPLGAVEQHGPHLPAGTDSQIISALAKELEQKLKNDILLCPTLPFGSSHHHLEFGGTISVSPTLYTQIIVEIVLSVLQSGFRKIILLNGHGGNITPVRQALSILSNRRENEFPANIVLATYWEVAGKPFTGAAPMESPALSHACEYETSLMLHLAPSLVNMMKARRPKRPLSNGYIAWEDDEPYRGVSIVKSTGYISDNGSSGEPQLGTKEKGEHLFKEALKALTDFVKEFKEWPIMEKLKKETQL